MNTKYSIAERVLTQAEFLNTEMLSSKTAEYSSRPHIIYSGQVMFDVIATEFQNKYKFYPTACPQTLC